MKNTIIALVVVLIVAVGGFFVWKSMQPNEVVVNKNDTAQPVVTPEPPVSVATTTPAPENKEVSVIGTSLSDRKISAYHYGTGAKEVLFVGGVHGGYEWNTSLVAFELMDYLKANPAKIPSSLTITVIPVLNPDGLVKVVGTDGRFAASDVSPSKEVTIAGRYNGNSVDLNRNFDCDWKSTGTWQNTKVSGGSAPFSEPESKAFQSYVTSKKPAAVVVWFSSAGGVYSSSCHNGISPETAAMTKAYADASGYPAFKEFNSYEITGDMVNWLAKNDIPAISVLLTNHTDTEWTKNQAGVEALLLQYSK